MPFLSKLQPPDAWPLREPLQWGPTYLAQFGMRVLDNLPYEALVELSEFIDTELVVHWASGCSGKDSPRFAAAGLTHARQTIAVAAEVRS